GVRVLGVWLRRGFGRAGGGGTNKRRYGAAPAIIAGVWTRLGTLCSSIDPRLDQLAKQRLAAGSGLATGGRLPPPSHQVIVSEMFVQQRQIAPAVGIAMFELSANLSVALALPRHLDGRHLQRGWPGML